MTSREFFHSSFHYIQKNIEQIQKLKEFIEEKETEIMELQKRSRKTT